MLTWGLRILKMLNAVQSGDLIIGEIPQSCLISRQLFHAMTPFNSLYQKGVVVLVFHLILLLVGYTIPEWCV